jgi:hypothetical protein
LLELEVLWALTLQKFNDPVLEPEVDFLALLEVVLPLMLQ